MIENKEYIRCQYCDELVSPRAKKCKHCGEILDVQLREIESLKRESMKDRSNIVVSNNNNNNNQGSTGTKRFPHVAHLIMSVLTGGAWVLIWLIHYIFRNKENYS